MKFERNLECEECNLSYKFFFLLMSLKCAHVALRSALPVQIFNQRDGRTTLKRKLKFEDLIITIRRCGTKLKLR